MDVYVMADTKVVVCKQTVHLQDIARLFCTSSKVMNKFGTLEVCRCPDKKHSQQVVDLYEILCSRLPENPDLAFQFLGATEVLVEYEQKEKGVMGSLWNILKIMFACCICFFGATFTIMAFHNDIGIGGVFENTYTVILGHHPKGLYVLEIAYSIGLATGIILFFNHIGGKKISKDPTPVEVAMNQYEQNVNQTVIAESKRTPQ